MMGAAHLLNVGKLQRDSTALHPKRLNFIIKIISVLKLNHVPWYLVGKCLKTQQRTEYEKPVWEKMEGEGSEAESDTGMTLPWK
jgi:hypothetical protein